MLVVTNLFHRRHEKTLVIELVKVTGLMSPTE
jgi:hypothetical protein